MRLKTFHAPTMNDAMALVREQLGEDAIIVTTHDAEGAQGVRVTAAVESDDPPEDESEFGGLDSLEVIHDALSRAGTPSALTERLVDSASVVQAGDPIMALAAALDTQFRFWPLSTGKNKRPVMLVGPPGTGKTVACAKLAARAILNSHSAALISTDDLRAGATEQLHKYADRMGAAFASAPDRKALAAAIKNVKGNDLVLIDTSGTNPFASDDMVRLADLMSGLDVDVVLVLDAGRNAEDAQEIALAFASLNPTRLLATGLDLSKRYGGLLAAADAARLSFSDVSATPEIAQGVAALNPVSLARLFWPETNDNASGSKPVKSMGPE